MGTIRVTVTDIEADLEHQLGQNHLAQLRELLSELNASAFVRGSRESEGAARSRSSDITSRSAGVSVCASVGA